MTFQASVHIYLCGPVLGVDIMSQSGESADVRSVSRIDNARTSPSLLELRDVVDCHQPIQFGLGHMAKSTMP